MAKIRKLSEVEQAWIACFIDSEGSIHISKVKEKRVKRGYMLMPWISLNNTNLPMMKHARKILGVGHLFFTKDKRLISKTGFRMKDRYTITLCANYIRELLPQIMHFLIVKKSQAEVMLHFLGQWVREDGSKILFRGDYPAEILKDYFKIKKLNRKGQPIETSDLKTKIDSEIIMEDR